MSAMECQIESIITCPVCGYVKRESMPLDYCQFFYDCAGCAAVLKPKPGDCCVYCSYGSTPCPPRQLEKNGLGQGCCGDRPAAAEKCG